MKKSLFIVMVMVMARMTVGGVICSGDSVPVAIDTRDEPIVDVLDISWNAAWVGDEEDATVVITDNGEEVKHATGVGEFTYTLSGSGRHELIYTTYIDGIAQDEVCSVVIFKDWKYNVADDGVIVVETSLKSDAVVIPSEIDGLGVIGVGSNVFSDCSDLTSVTIPDSVTNIGASAFSGCGGLTSVTIPQCVCANRLSSVFSSSYSHITNVVISDSVTNIGNSAFSGCSGLTSVTIPDSVTSIGDYAFSGCSGLTSVTIPQYVLDRQIGSVFPSACHSITNVSYSSAISIIGPYALSGCSGLASVTIPEGVTSIGDHAFSGCGGLENVTIPDGVTSIGSSVFSGCSGLADVTIPESVTSIGDEVFYGCSGLKSVTIPDGVMSIGSSVFSGCSSLMSVTIPERVRSIGDEAFSGCSRLASITIPDSVTSIGYGTFYDCASLLSATMGSGVTSIGDEAFSGCSGLTSVTIPDKVTNIGYGTFYDCTNLLTVTMGSGVARIGDEAFSGCSSLTSVTIPDEVTSIGSCAFYGCSELSSVTIPDSVTEIGEAAFFGCNNITNMVLGFLPEGDYVEWCDLNGRDRTLYLCGVSYLFCQFDFDSDSDYIIIGRVPLVDVTISSSISEIGAYAFKGCNHLRTVMIPDSVTSIGNNAFSGCGGLTSVTMPQVVCDLGLSTVFPAAYQALSSVYISDSVTNIADYAFAGCTNLQTEVWGGYRVLDGWLIGYTDEAEETIPDADKLKGICSEALKGCTALRRLEFGDNSRLVSVGAEALKGCTELKTLVLPPSLTRIGDEAFMGCSYLDNVIVPGGVKSIGNRAFKNCTGFTWAQIEHGVESIGGEAFYGCWRITEVDIPSSVSSIGVNAFGGDSSITKVALRGDIRKVSEIFSTYAQITEATVKIGAGAVVDGLFSECWDLRKVVFLGNCPALVNEGRNLYYGTPSNSSLLGACGGPGDSWEDEPYSGLVTYVDRDSTGWDGTPGSHVLPMKWPLVGDYRREIRYTDAISTPCAVTFDANGGTPTTQSVEQRSEETFVLPSEPKRADHVFMGWWTEKNGGVRVTDETVFLTGVYETLYAHWTKKRAVSAQICEDTFSGYGTVELDDDDNIVVTLTSDVNGTVEIPDDVGRVLIDLNGHSIIGADGSAAIRVVSGNGDGEITRLSIGDTSDGDKGIIAGDGESVAIDIADDAAPSVHLDVYDDVAVLNGDGTEQQWRELFPVELSIQAGEYFKATLAELGYDVPTDGTPYEVKALGLPAGLKLKYNAAVKDKKGKVVKKAKSEWWIEGVPTAALDFFTNPPYLVITVNGAAGVCALPVEVLAQDVTMLEDLALGQSLNEQHYLPGVTNGWTVSGLPTGLKYTAKLLTTSKKVGKKTVVTTNALPYSVYGKTTKAGLFTITAKQKVGGYYETLKYRVLVKPAPVDTALFGEELANITTMAYVPFEWDLTNDVAAVGGKVAKVAGLPAGLAFASATTYKDKKKTQVKQYGQTIVGTPTKPGTYVVTFTKNVTTGTGKNKKTVAKTAQILWTVTANDANLELGFNTAGGMIEGGTVGLKYGDLLAFSATDGATVTASGLPKGIALANLGDGNYAFTGFTAKAGTYLVAVTVTLNGKTVTQRMALDVDGLPSWAKGTFNGYIAGADGATNGLATITVSSVGKISGKFYEGGTNWTFTAASYTGYDSAAPACSVPVVAKYSYKEKEKVKVNGKWTTKTVAKYVARDFTLRVGQDALGGTATLEEVDGSTVHAWQNLWGSTYKAIGKKLFYTSKKKPYRVFTINGTSDIGMAMGLLPAETLSLKVTPTGAVTATMSFDTGKKSKGKAVIYKPTCATVVIPLFAADAEEFEGEAILFFAPSSANNFPGFAGAAPF